MKATRSFSEDHLAERCQAVHSAIRDGRTDLTPGPAETVSCPFCNTAIMIVKRQLCTSEGEES